MTGKEIDKRRGPGRRETHREVANRAELGRRDKTNVKTLSV